MRWSETVTLMRGQVPVTSFLGSLGGSLRETRITAMLGYLIAHEPSPWGVMFQFSKPISSVTVEADYDRDRADVVIDTPTERVVVEAKVSWSDPKSQVSRYKAHRKYLFTNYKPSSIEHSGRLRYVDWEEVAIFLESLARKTGKLYVRHLTMELIRYMRDHQLTRSRVSVEIYARELNDEIGRAHV